MDKEIYQEAETLIRRLEKASKFSARFQTYPFGEAKNVVLGMQHLAEKIPEIPEPANNEEVRQAELRRRLIGGSSMLEDYLDGKSPTFQRIMRDYGIQQEDLDALLPWLEKNKERTQRAVERLYQVTDIKNYELSLPLDIPAVRRGVEEFARIIIEKYHRQMGQLLQERTQAGQFLRDVSAVPTLEGRSYFHSLTKTIALAVSRICHLTEDGSIHFRPRELIKLYGHEGMGHALSNIITNQAELPYFLKHESGPVTVAANESVAQWYQQVIFNDLKDAPETQKALDIAHNYLQIWQEAQDIQALEEYGLKCFQYAVLVLADRSLGDKDDSRVIKERIARIEQVSLDPMQAKALVENNRYHYDSEGNLQASLVSELRYTARPVERALQEFKKAGILYEGSGRSHIDMILLTGFWTPQGFVENARVNAKAV